MFQVDVDTNKATAEECGIETVPTYHFYRNGVKIDEFKGVDIDMLRAKILFMIQRKNRRAQDKEAAKGPATTGGGRKKKTDKKKL